MAWVTVIVGLVGLVLGNFLNRSTEYRKWRRTERHKACSQLLDASQATMLVATWHMSAQKPVADSMKSIGEEATRALESAFGNPLSRWLLKPFARALARKMNPGSSSKDLDTTLSGVIASIGDRSRAGAENLIIERLGVGRNGTLTEFREGASRLGTAIEAVELICPNKVVDAGWRLYWAALGLLHPGEEDTGEHDKNQKERTAEYRQSRDAFVRAARRDLVGFPTSRKP